MIQKPICKKCSLYLELNLGVDEGCNIIKLAELHRDDKLKSVVRFFMQMHATEVKATGGQEDVLKYNPKLAFESLKKSLKYLSVITQ